MADHPLIVSLSNAPRGARRRRSRPTRRSADALQQTAFLAAKARSVAVGRCRGRSRRFRITSFGRGRGLFLFGRSGGRRAGVVASRHLQTYPGVLWKHGNLVGLLAFVRSQMGFGSALLCYARARLIRMIARIVVKTLRVQADALISLCPAPLVLKQSDVGQTCPTVTMLCQYVMGIS